MLIVSARVKAADAAFARRGEPGICDFTFGNPHEIPIDGLVTALRERAVPHDKNWFAYKTHVEGFGINRVLAYLRSV